MAKEKETTSNSEENYRDPTLFLFLWLGVPMIAMFGYAYYLNFVVK